MAKRVTKRKPRAEEEAELAAREAVAEMEQETHESPEHRDIALAISENNQLSDREIDEKDIFAEGKKKFIARNTSGQFRIYRDGAWVGTKPSSYTWEKLRNDFGKQGGHFKVVAIDGNNQFAGSQSLEVAAIEESDVEQQAPQGTAGGSPLEMLELMKENQREAESKAQSQQTGLASVMASVVQMQTQSTQMMMQMYQKSSEQTQNLMIAMMTQQQQPKGPDPMVALLTTLLTQKPHETGPKATELIKMLEDAKRDAKKEAKDDARELRETAKKLAEDMAPANDGEESLTKTLIKSFGPVLADVMAKNQQAQAAAQIEEQRRMQGNGGLNRGFIENRESRQAIPAAHPNERHRPRPQPAPTAQASIAPAPPVGASVPPQAATAVQTATVVEPSVEKGPAEVIPAQEPVIDSRLQEQLFNFCAADIGNALLQQQPALRTAQICLAKLEKEGVPRQTVVSAFRLQDFYAYAERFNLPPEAKPWLEEFHESIAKSQGPVPVRASADTGATPRTAQPVRNGVNGNGANRPAASRMAVNRSPAPGARTRTQPPGRAHDL